MWVLLGKRGHHKPLLTCQAIFISLSDCTAVQHSMSFTIHSLKRHKKMNYYHKNLENGTRAERIIQIKKGKMCNRNLNIDKVTIVKISERTGMTAFLTRSNSLTEPFKKAHTFISNCLNQSAEVKCNLFLGCTSPGKWRKVWMILNQRLTHEQSFLPSRVSFPQGRPELSKLCQILWRDAEDDGQGKVSSYKRVMGDVREVQSSTCSPRLR